MESVRPSRDGHEYHEAWLTRRSLGLLFPKSNLIAIAVEGLSPEDELDAPNSTIEVADATFYFGTNASFDDASRIEISQFKYSALHSDDEFRATDAAKTLRKFAASELNYLSKHEASVVQVKIRYSIVTNRPISAGLQQAVSAIALGQTPSDADTKNQFDQFKSAIAVLSDTQAQAFASRLILDGGAGSLTSVKGSSSRIIADWSPSSDLQVKARLGELRDLVRNKAGTSGDQKNLIFKENVLAALGIGEEEDLLPTLEAFPTVGSVVPRLQQSDFINNLASAACWVVEADGGVGKTVFLQSVASILQSTDEVVLFDCFGGGAYRSPTDARYRPERGLLHIVNELACRGLCDPLLPGATDHAEVVRRAGKRFQQTIAALRHTNPQSRLILIIDAADNAAVEADKLRQPSFPRDLLEATSYDQIDGLVIIASSRPERRNQAVGKAICATFKLGPFSIDEARAFIIARRKDATDDQVSSIFRRSDGIPRVILNLIDPSRSLSGDDDQVVSLPGLIQDRLDSAIREATEKGAPPLALDTFLCALSSLPPPVPLAELADGFGISESEIQGFAADLSPLLERTKHGVVFRDEPTDNLVRERYGDKKSLLAKVAKRLLSLQATSVYAARALPDLLYSMGKTKELHALAFDSRFPQALDSDVARRGIRLSRLQTALRAAAENNDRDKIVDLLVELATIAVVHERGEEFLTKNPDLVIALGDPEAQRKLFESRSGWFGARPARLAIAYTTDEDLGEAYRFAERSNNWLNWFLDRDDDNPRHANPEINEFTALPFYLFAKGRMADARRNIARWRNFHGYKVSVRLFDLCRTSHSLGKLVEFDKLVSQLVLADDAPIGLVAGALSVSSQLGSNIINEIIRRLAARVQERTSDSGYDDDNDSFRQAHASLKPALIRAALRALSAGLVDDAGKIFEFVRPPRYNAWALRDHWDTEQLVPNVLALAINSVLTGNEATLFDCLPSQYFHYVKEVPTPLTDDEREKALLSEISRKKPNEPGEKQPKEPLDENEKYRVRDVLSSRLRPLLQLVRTVTALLKDPSPQSRKHYFESWRAAALRSRSDGFDHGGASRFSDRIYSQCALQVFSAIGFTADTASDVVDALKDGGYLSTWIATRFIEEFSVLSDCAEAAGTLAALTVVSIEGESDTQLRASLFADLARAILPANLNEATALFKRGLSELSAIGSGDYFFVSQLLMLTATLKKPLRPEHAHRLAKICELNIPDESGKFGWPLASNAFSKAWGIGYLAQICRWHDREKVDLEWTLSPTLQFLMKEKLLAPADAVTLIELTNPRESWDWRWPQFLEALIAAKPVHLKKTLDEFFARYEFENPMRPDQNVIKGFKEVLAKNPEAGRAARLQMQRFEDRYNDIIESPREKGDRERFLAEPRDEAAEQAEENSQIDLAVDATDPTDKDSFDALVEKLEQIRGHRNIKALALTALRKKVGYKQRYDHLAAIAASNNLELFSKIAVLKEIKAEWKASLPNIGQWFDTAGAQLARMHASDIMSREWGLGSELKELAELTEQSTIDLAVSLLATPTPYAEIFDATCLMSLASSYLPES